MRLTAVLEKILESPLNSKVIKPVHPTGNQPWIFIGRTDAEAPKLWPPDAKSWLIGKDSDAGKDWGQEEKGTTEHEMVGWHHRLNGYGFGWTLGVSDGQRGLACCDSWGQKELDMTEQLNWTELRASSIGYMGRGQAAYRVGLGSLSPTPLSSFLMASSLRKAPLLSFIFMHVEVIYIYCLKRDFCLKSERPLN